MSSLLIQTSYTSCEIFTIPKNLKIGFSGISARHAVPTFWIPESNDNRQNLQTI